MLLTVSLEGPNKQSILPWVGPTRVFNHVMRRTDSVIHLALGRTSTYYQPCHEKDKTSNPSSPWVGPTRVFNHVLRRTDSVIHLALVRTRTCYQPCHEKDQTSNPFCPGYDRHVFSTMSLEGPTQSSILPWVGPAHVINHVLRRTKQAIHLALGRTDTCFQPCP